MARDFDSPVSRCPACLASRRGPGSCPFCGWGSPPTRPDRGIVIERRKAGRDASGPARKRGGCITDLGRVLDEAIGDEGIEP